MEYYLSRREFGGIGIRKFNEFLDTHNNSELIPETLILYSKLFSIYLAKTRCFIIIKCSPNLIKKKKKLSRPVSSFPRALRWIKRVKL